jgi:hypothetical protein
VQHKLRYFALSLGEGGLVPRGIEAIWNTRFGDCKDAAHLYVAGARRMGLDVCAALVSTTHGPALDDFLPSPNVFNHCIVRLRLNAASYWLDPTLQMQSGDLENIFLPHVGWALPLTPETECLEKLASETPLHFLDWMLKELQATWPAVAETEPMRICDDRGRNCFTAILSYEIRDCWKRIGPDGRLGFAITDLVTARELNPLKGTPRQTDIYLGHPRKITRRLRMDMPRNWAGQGWQRVQKVPGISYTDQLSIDGRTIDHIKKLVIEAWSVPAAQAGDYGQVSSKLRENLLTIWARERFGKVRPFARARPVGDIMWILLSLTVFLFLTTVLIIFR